MTAAPLAFAPPDALGLPAPFLAIPRTEPASTVRRSGVGLGVALLLHAALLAALVIGMSEMPAPITPPQPYLTVSLITPDAPAPAPQPAPQARPEVREKTPTPKVQPRPAPQPRAADKPTLTSAAIATNPVESSAPAAAPAPVATAAPAKEAPAAPVAITAPRFDAAYLANPAPPYPSASKRMGEEGRVLLRVQVGVDGRPTEVSIARSSGFSRLDDIARETVLRSWRFVPARQGDQPVAGAVKVPIDFTLTSAS